MNNDSTRSTLALQGSVNDGDILAALLHQGEGARHTRGPRAHDEYVGRLRERHGGGGGSEVGFELPGGAGFYSLGWIALGGGGDDYQRHL